METKRNNKIVLVLDERTSLEYAALAPQKEYTDNELKELGRQWIRKYIKDKGLEYNPFYCIVTTENEGKRVKRRYKI